MPRRRIHNIGMVDCPTCGDKAAVRRNARELLYLMCGDCGHFRLTLPMGQRWINDHAEIWGDNHPPAHAPRWIQEHRAWKHTRERYREMYDGADPPLDLEPDPEPASNTRSDDDSGDEAGATVGGSGQGRPEASEPDPDQEDDDDEEGFFDGIL